MQLYYSFKIKLFLYIWEIVCQVVFPNLVWNVTSGDRWIMALEATKLASTSTADMSGPGGRGGAAPVLPDYPTVVFKNIEILKFALSNSHLTPREHWAYNWSGQCGNQENSVTTTWNMNWPDYLALNGAGMHGSTFSLNFCFVAFSSHPGPGISPSLRKSNRGSAVPLNCPGNGWKPNLLSKQRIFMAQFFNPDIFHFSQLKIWTAIQSDEDVYVEIFDQWGTPEGLAVKCHL